MKNNNLSNKSANVHNHIHMVISTTSSPYCEHRIQDLSTRVAKLQELVECHAQEH